MTLIKNDLRIKIHENLRAPEGKKKLEDVLLMIY